MLYVPRRQPGSVAPLVWQCDDNFDTPLVFGVYPKIVCCGPIRCDDSSKFLFEYLCIHVMGSGNWSLLRVD